MSVTEGYVVHFVATGSFAYCDMIQIYVGSISTDEVKEKVESAKLVISVGAMLSDFNTGNFTYHIPKSNIVEVRTF